MTVASSDSYISDRNFQSLLLVNCLIISVDLVLRLVLCLCSTIDAHLPRPSNSSTLTLSTYLQASVLYLDFHLLLRLLPLVSAMTRNDTIVQLYESGFNITLLNNTDLCTRETCPLSIAQVHYDLSLGGNAFFLALFSLLLVLQLAFGFKWRTWSFTGSIFGGLVLEILGYVSRVQMHYNPWNGDAFLM